MKVMGVKLEITDSRQVVYHFDVFDANGSKVWVIADVTPHLKFIVKKLMPSAADAARRCIAKGMSGIHIPPTREEYRVLSA